MNKLPYQTKIKFEGGYKTVTKNIWTLEEAKIVAEDQFLFINREIYVFDADEQIVMAVSSVRRKKSLY